MNSAWHCVDAWCWDRTLLSSNGFITVSASPVRLSSCHHDCSLRRGRTLLINRHFTTLSHCLTMNMNVSQQERNGEDTSDGTPKLISHPAYPVWSVSKPFVTTALREDEEADLRKTPDPTVAQMFPCGVNATSWLPKPFGPSIRADRWQETSPLIEVWCLFLIQ